MISLAAKNFNVQTGGGQHQSSQSIMLTWTYGRLVSGILVHAASLPRTGRSMSLCRSIDQLIVWRCMSGARLVHAWCLEPYWTL